MGKLQFWTIEYGTFFFLVPIEDSFYSLMLQFHWLTYVNSSHFMKKMNGFWDKIFFFKAQKTLISNNYLDWVFCPNFSCA